MKHRRPNPSLVLKNIKQRITNFGAQKWKWERVVSFKGDKIGMWHKANLWALYVKALQKPKPIKTFKAFKTIKHKKGINR